MNMCFMLHPAYLQRQLPWSSRYPMSKMSSGMSLCSCGDLNGVPSFKELKEELSCSQSGDSYIGLESSALFCAWEYVLWNTWSSKIPFKTEGARMVELDVSDLE